MLPRVNRLTRPIDFRSTIRSGRKSRRSTVIVYATVPAVPTSSVEATTDVDAPRIGITVSKAVGGSVVRHRVARIVRHCVAGVIPRLPAGSNWVIRALPPAGEADAGEAVRGDVYAAFSEILEDIGPEHARQVSAGPAAGSRRP